MEKQKSSSRIIKKRAKRESRSFLKKGFIWFFYLVILLIISGGSAITGFYFYISDDLPKISTLNDYRPPVITTVYSDDESKIAEFYNERRIVVPLSEIPKILVDAFVAAEDARFFKHKGIDIYSVIRAFFKNIEAGTIVQGGSTITQQVTKSFLLTSEKSYSRKIKEAILAYRIDKLFKKEEILYLYLNQIYMGHGAYGVEAAAENYFGKMVKDLNLAECAILAGLPQAPSNYSPFRYPERAQKRQIYVLKRMVAEGYITNIQADEAIHTVLDIKPRRNWYIEKVPCYTEHIRRYVEKKYGKDKLYNGGLKIYTAVNVDTQRIARHEIEKGLKALDKRQGYRGAGGHLAPEEIESFLKELGEKKEFNESIEDGKIVKGVVINIDNNENKATVRMVHGVGIIKIENMIWARKPNIAVAYYEAKISHPGEALKVGDVIMVNVLGKVAYEKKKEIIWDLALEQEPEVQAALLCIEGETGHVKVMIGGRDFKDSQFNRAIQSRRQPGSAFKPVIYAAALDKGFTAATVIIDSPIVFEDKKRDFTWKPKNYEKKFFGPTLFRTALEKSHNVITVKILRDIGVDYAIDYAKKLGINSRLSKDLSIALGSSGISLLEAVKAYSVFANSGYLVQPVFITRIVDRDGNIIEEVIPRKEKVIEKSTAYIMTNLLEGVIKYGTGRRVRSLNRPCAGKTGTTNNLFDAWFVGYTPGYITGTWVGYDNERDLGKGETGSRAASPIWLGFMNRLLRDKPVRGFQVPDDVVFLKIDADTGLLPIPESDKTIFECFKEGTAPTQHTKKSDTITNQEQFFKSGV